MKALLFAALGAALLTGCLEKEPPPAVSSTEITVTAVEKKDILISEKSSGDVLSTDPITIKAVTGGVVTDVSADKTVFPEQTLLKLQVNELLKTADEINTNTARLEALQREGVHSAELAHARKESERINRELANTTLKAPVAGSLDKVLVKKGDVVFAGQPLFVLQPETKKLVLKFPFPASAERITAGQMIKISIPDSKDPPVKGNIKSLEQHPKDSRFAFSAVVELEPQYAAQFKPGSSNIEGEVIIANKTAVPVLPESAIAERDGKKVVFVREGEATKVKMKEIEVGEKNNGLVEIVKGLAVGDTVANSNLDQLDDDSVIKVKE